MTYLAERALSEQKKHPLLLYRLPSNIELCYKFRWDYSGKDFHSYKCFGCCEVAKISFNIRVKSLRVDLNYGSFLSNPEMLTHVCQARGFTYNYLNSVVQQTYRQVCDTVKENGFKPTVAKAKVRDIVQTNHHEDNVSALLTLPSPKAMTKTFSNKRKFAQIEDFDPLAPPTKLFASALTRNNDESLLLRTYSQVYPPFMFLSDRTNLEAIHSASILMFDGTFAYCPREFYRQSYTINDGQDNEEVRTMSGQVYTMHAVFNDLPNFQSSFLSGIGFLSHKNEQEYDQLFGELRMSLIDEFGNVGCGKTVMFDMEPAAHKMLKKHFPEWQLRSCYFHFFKSIKGQAEKKGLHEAFKNGNFMKWFNGLMGSVFLDFSTARVVFLHLLDNPPTITQNIASFLDYLRRFWLPKLELVICWDTEQPRTNNPAESYHSKLSVAFQNDEHPGIGTAFNVFSGHLNDGAIEFLKSEIDSESPNLQQRTRKAREFDQKLLSAKSKLVNFVNSLLPTQSMPIDYLLHYARHIRFLTSGLSSSANPDAVLKFDPLPVPLPLAPILQRPMLLPRVLGPSQEFTNLQRGMLPRIVRAPRQTSASRSQSQSMQQQQTDDFEEIDILG